MAEQKNTKDAYPSLPMFLKSQPELYDLHTHLLGMGNAGFWVDTILMDPKVMPTHTDFTGEDETIRKKFCPLIWDKEGNTGFVDGTKAAAFFYYLYEENILPVEEDNILPRDENNTGSGQKKISDVIEDLKKQFSPVLCELIEEKFNRELLHQGLCFKENFSYDVVLTLSDLAEGLGIKKLDGIEFEQLAITEKLIGYLSPGQGIFFDHYIYFNARKQKFEIDCGIQVEKLRNLITVDPEKPSEAKKLARAHIINAFSMCDAQGTPARLVDFHTFHGSFTPEFCPRRFALKDSMYGQRLDVLATLIEHVAERYQTSLPPVTYCEFSVGVSDLSRPWVFDVLRSIGTYLSMEITQNGGKDPTKHTYIASEKISSFSQIVLDDHFPHLQNVFPKPKADNPCKPRFTYKFLAGFGRQKVALPLFKNQNDALRLLYNSPQHAIFIMLEEIAKSQKEAGMSQNTSKQSHTSAEKASGPFGPFIDLLEELKRNGEKIPSFYDWVVGLDLFGDELGYPYCPFVARPFIKYVKDRREGKDGKKINKRFGLRIHCGENVIYADGDSPTYRLFIAHMYIVFRCLRFLQCELESGIRIGHGIAFDRIFGTTMIPSQHRKSSVLLAEMREHANYLFKTIAFEVNITSNEYLLGQTLRQGKFGEILRLNGLFKLKAKIILATDDDGIWPIDRCSFTHPGHHSLSAEYCRAISTSLIETSEQLKNILDTTKDFCFSGNDGELKIADKKSLLPDDKRINRIIIHPSIIKLIRQEYTKATRPEVHPALDKFKIYDGDDSISNDNINWKNSNGSMRVAFICACFMYDNDDQIENEEEEIRKEYCNLFQAGREPTIVNNEFKFIYENLKEIRSKFVFPKQDRKESKPSKIAPYIKMTPRTERQRHDVVYSEPEPEPEPQNVREGKPLHEIFVDFLKQFRGKKVTIRAFSQDMDIEKTVDAINGQVNNKDDADRYKDVIVTIYTNPNKHKYTYSTINHRFKLQVNPKPSKRDCTNQNFLYVLCPHASAATVAVHLINEQLFETSIDLPTTSSTNNDTNHISTTKPSTSTYNYKGDSEEKNANEQLLQKPHEENSQKPNLKRTHSKEETEPDNKRSSMPSTSES